jgi:hypothetical protein
LTLYTRPFQDRISGVSGRPPTVELVTGRGRDKIPSMYRGVLSSGLGSHWRREVLRTSLWFVPALEVVAAIVLFAGTLAVDRAAYHGDFTCRAG